MTTSEQLKEQYISKILELFYLKEITENINGKLECEIRYEKLCKRKEDIRARIQSFKQELETKGISARDKKVCEEGIKMLTDSVHMRDGINTIEGQRKAYEETKDMYGTTFIQRVNVRDFLCHPNFFNKEVLVFFYMNYSLEIITTLKSLKTIEEKIEYFKKNIEVVLIHAPKITSFKNNETFDTLIIYDKYDDVDKNYQGVGFWEQMGLPKELK